MPSVVREKKSKSKKNSAASKQQQSGGHETARNVKCSSDEISDSNHDQAARKRSKKPKERDSSTTENYDGDVSGFDYPNEDEKIEVVKPFKGKFAKKEHKEYCTSKNLEETPSQWETDTDFGKSSDDDESSKNNLNSKGEMNKKAAPPVEEHKDISDSSSGEAKFSDEEDLYVNADIEDSFGVAGRNIEDDNDDDDSTEQTDDEEKESDDDEDHSSVSSVGITDIDVTGDSDDAPNIDLKYSGDGAEEAGDHRPLSCAYKRSHNIDIDSDTDTDSDEPKSSRCFMDDEAVEASYLEDVESSSEVGSDDEEEMLFSGGTTTTYSKNIARRAECSESDDDSFVVSDDVVEFLSADDDNDHVGLRNRVSLTKKRYSNIITVIEDSSHESDESEEDIPTLMAARRIKKNENAVTNESMVSKAAKTSKVAAKSKVAQHIEKRRKLKSIPKKKIKRDRIFKVFDKELKVYESSSANAVVRKVDTGIKKYVEVISSVSKTKPNQNVSAGLNREISTSKPESQSASKGSDQNVCVGNRSNTITKSKAAKAKKVSGAPKASSKSTVIENSSNSRSIPSAAPAIGGKLKRKRGESISPKVSSGKKIKRT